MFHCYAGSSAVSYVHVGHWSVVGSLVKRKFLHYCVCLHLIVYVLGKDGGVMRWCSDFLHFCAVHLLIFEFHLTFVFSPTRETKSKCIVRYLFSVVLINKNLRKLYCGDLHNLFPFHMFLGPYLNKMWVHMSTVLRMRTLRRIFGPKGRSNRGVEKTT
jgi:hypothetical protein